MNIWVKNSSKNLLPLSEEKEDFKIALKEWIFTGEIVDHETPIETCELCEKDELRYHFEIKNQLDNSLWVGSKCIEKFDITIFDEHGNEITENKDQYLQKQARKKHIKLVFENLDKTDGKGKTNDRNNKELDIYCIDRYNLEGKLDPKMLNYLFKRLDDENIFYDKRFFAISLKKEENKVKLLNLNGEQFERIKKALSLTQRKYYENNKNKYTATNMGLAKVGL
ncbi:MAG: hypothetical protein IPP48_06215 [Chitinophagaceae bacterium]|nr:hypothetical protein [Chitinophagaceae bacterium]